MAAKEKTNVDIKQGKCCRLWEPSEGIKHFFKINCGLKALFYQVKVSHRGLQQLEPVLEGLGQPQPVLEGLRQLGAPKYSLVRHFCMLTCLVTNC